MQIIARGIPSVIKGWLHYIYSVCGAPGPHPAALLTNQMGWSHHQYSKSQLCLSCCETALL